MKDLVAACLLLGACTGRTDTVLTVAADAPVEQYDLYVRSDVTKELVLHTDFTAVDKARDLTKSPLKIALKLANGGRYTLLLVGVIGEVENGKPAMGATQLFAAAHFSGGADVPVTLLTVPEGDDLDRDLWPDAGRFKGKLDLLDCADDPTSIIDGGAYGYSAADLNPFAVEVCDGIDRDCDGRIAEDCADKDGDASATDCDDNDAKRHRPTTADPYPDPANCCGYSLGKAASPDAHKDFTGSPLCPAQRCGDGIDESCQGLSNDPANDTRCIVDADCDGDPASPVGNDCDDHDPAVHAGALEPCGATKDLNCDGRLHDGCVPCDLDGDGYQRNDAANGCPDAANLVDGKFDCNDYDAAVFPTSGQTEGGTTNPGRVTSALRGYCRRVYEPTGVTGTIKLDGDADCNGAEYEGCPSVACDQDGDGFMRLDALCEPDQKKADCHDDDPTVFPHAPVGCMHRAQGAIVPPDEAQNCVGFKADCLVDFDNDGYDSPADCDDYDSATHPFAAERCDSVDNDCDGLVDEGNPDTSGAPMVANGAVTGCTDSNVGECGKTEGVCVCSASPSMSTREPANKRVICPTEDSGSPKPPHCFGAGQPHPQSCDKINPKDDDCDGRTDAPDGVALSGKGMPCGIMGPGPVSRVGVVSACDMSLPEPLVCSAQGGP